MNRRSFLTGLVAAPAVVAAANIMPVRAIERLLVPTIWGDGIHDDAPGLNALLSGRPFVSKLKTVWLDHGLIVIGTGRFALGSTVHFNVPEGVVTDVIGNNFRALPGLKAGAPMLHLPKSAKRVWMVSNFLTGNGRCDAIKCDAPLQPLTVR